jgi:hypothetical protein
MTRIHWWAGIAGILIMAGAMAGCGGGDHDNGRSGSGVCVLFNEIEPNATPLTAQFLGDMVSGDCFIVAGSISDVTDVDSYRVLVQENLTVVVTLDHSALVNFDVQLFDADTGQLIRNCGVPVVPEVCAVSFDVRARDIAVDVVVFSVVGAGTYTLTLDAR